MDRKIQEELIKKLYINPLRQKEQLRRKKIEEVKEKIEEVNEKNEEVNEKVLFRTTQPILTNINTNDYIDKLFNNVNNVNNVNNSNIEKLLTDLEKVHVNTINQKTRTRTRTRKRNQENNIRNVKKIKLELEKIQEKIKELEYIFHIGKSTPLTKKELKEKNILRRKKEFAKTYKITNHNTIPVKIIYKPLSKAAITRKLNKLKEKEEALKLIIEKRLRSGKL
jgi:hypothetical protein